MTTVRSTVLADGEDLCAHLRRCVEEGAEDGPMLVFVPRAGEIEKVFRIKSLYRAALLAVSEDPTVRFVDWHPHPRATIGPRVAALLEARRVRREEKQAVRIKKAA